jgi:hypothetical protein
MAYGADAPPPPSLDTPAATGTAEPAHPEVVVPPDLPKDSDSRDAIKPEVNIIHRDDATVEEYRVGGRLRYAKIIPKVGKPYYFVDTDGDGTLDTRYNDLENPPLNQWILMEW